MKAYTAYSHFQGCSNSSYPMHSGERYRTIWSSGYIFFIDCGTNKMMARGQIDFTNADSTDNSQTHIVHTYIHTRNGHLSVDSVLALQLEDRWFDPPLL